MGCRGVRAQQAASASELPGAGGMRNVQSTHAFFPQAGPAPPAAPPLQGGEMRPHSWDSAPGQLASMASFLGQSQMLQQLNPQLLASLSAQVACCIFSKFLAALLTAACQVP